MIECNFVKPGKGQALYKCKLKHLIRAPRSTAPTRAAIPGCRRRGRNRGPVPLSPGDHFVFMDNESYEQYELTSEQVSDTWRNLKEGMNCSMVLFNNGPIFGDAAQPRVLGIEYCEPAPAATRPPT